MKTFDCIVIGGGVSGLVTATRMAEAGKNVALLEAGSRLGGCIQTWRPESDFWLELGAHTAYNSYGPLLEALNSRGRLDELLHREKLGYQFVQANGRLQSPLKRLCFLEAAVSLPFGMFKPKDGKTVSEWFGRLLGKRNYRHLLAPAFAAVLSQSADRFPAAWLFRRKPRMKSAPRKFTFHGGLQGLLEAIAEGAAFELQREAKVSQIVRTENGWTVLVGEEELAAQQLVVATPVDVSAALVASPYPEAGRILQSFPMSSSEALAVVLPATASALPAVAGLIGETTEGNAPFWSVVTRDPIPHPVYRGFTFHFRPGILSREEKLASAAAMLQVAVTDFLHVAETINRLPAPSVEHTKRVTDLDALLAGEPIALVGNYLNGLSIGDCAERAAQESARLLSQFERSAASKAVAP